MLVARVSVVQSLDGSTLSRQRWSDLCHCFPSGLRASFQVGVDVAASPVRAPHFLASLAVARFLYACEFVRECLTHQHDRLMFIRVQDAV